MLIHLRPRLLTQPGATRQKPYGLYIMRYLRTLRTPWGLGKSSNDTVNSHSQNNNVLLKEQNSYMEV
jgi:hypothetical protein